MRAEELYEVCWLADGRAGLLVRFKMLRDWKMPLTYLNGMNSTLHFLRTWHQESGAKKLTQQSTQRIRGCGLWIITWHTSSALTAAQVLAIQLLWS